MVSMDCNGIHVRREGCLATGGLRVRPRGGGVAGEGDGCAATKVWAAVIVIGVSVQYGLAGVCGGSAETDEAASGGGD